MKIKLFATFFALLGVSTSQAALYSLSNNSGGDSVIGITEKDGLPGSAVATRGFQTTEAFAAFGVFNVSDSVIQSTADASQLWTSFVQFGTNVKSFTSATGGANGVATPAMTSAVTVTGNATFENQNMYFVVANVANPNAITSTTQFFVYKTGNKFLASDDSLVGTTAKTFNGTDGTLLIGEFGNFSFKTRNTDTTTGSGFNTVLVPETSTSLLGALGALALLRRRRN